MSELSINKLELLADHLKLTLSISVVTSEQVTRQKILPTNDISICGQNFHINLTKTLKKDA